MLKWHFLVTPLNRQCFNKPKPSELRPPLWRKSVIDANRDSQSIPTIITVVNHESFR
jgi:hypothetical protein